MFMAMVSQKILSEKWKQTVPLKLIETGLATSQSHNYETVYVIHAWKKTEKIAFAYESRLKQPQLVTTESLSSSSYAALIHSFWTQIRQAYIKLRFYIINLRSFLCINACFVVSLHAFLLSTLLIKQCLGRVKGNLPEPNKNVKYAILSRSEKLEQSTALFWSVLLA